MDSIITAFDHNTSLHPRRWYRSFLPEEVEIEAEIDLKGDLTDTYPCKNTLKIYPEYNLATEDHFDYHAHTKLAEWYDLQANLIQARGVQAV